jgi:23S rRNA (uracil1939-C5)-methyltransferase
MSIQKGQLHEVDISGVAYGGKGIVHIEGFAVFVDQAVPGDRARIFITRKIMPKPAWCRSFNRPGTGFRRPVPTAAFAGGANGSFWTMTGNWRINGGMLRNLWRISA